jgi:hypothetical protein
LPCASVTSFAPALRVGYELCALGPDVVVDVTERDVFGVLLHPEDVLDMAAALAVEADGAYAHTVVGAEYFSLSFHAGNDDRCRARADKMSAGEFHIGW